MLLPYVLLGPEDSETTSEWRFRVVPDPEEETDTNAGKFFGQPEEGEISW